jgi:hypothetical protein
VETLQAPKLLQCCAPCCLSLPQQLLLPAPSTGLLLPPPYSPLLPPQTLPVQLLPPQLLQPPLQQLHALQQP